MEPGLGAGSFDSEYSVVPSISCRCPKTKGECDSAWSWIGATLYLNAPLILSPSPSGEPD